MKLRSVLLPIIALTACLSGVINPASVEASVCSISSTPTVASIVPGGSFDVKIRVSTDTASRGAQFILSWDPTLVTCNSFTKGTFYDAVVAQQEANGGQLFWSPNNPIIDNTAGTFPKQTSTSGVNLAAVAAILPGAPEGLGATGQGDLYILHMSAKTGVAGTVTFALSNVKLGDATEAINDLQPAIINGSVLVGTPPPPPITPGGWAPVTSLPVAGYLSLWANSNNDATIIGDAGTILHYDGTFWSQMPSGVVDTLEDVWARSPNDVFAVGRRADNYGVILHNTGSGWTSEITAVPYQFYGVWGTGADVFAVGHNGWNGLVMHYTGSAWEPIYFSVYRPREIWGSSASDLWVICEGGKMLHFDGANWSNVNSGTTQDLLGIWGLSSDNIFVSGGNGTILHFNGTNWTPMNSGTTVQLSGIWGSGANDMFVAGAGGTIMHYDGVAWRPMDSATTENLNDIMGASLTDIYSVGSNGTVIHYFRSIPVVSSFTPTVAVAGQIITINGSYFTGTTAVSIGGIPAQSFVVESDTLITAIVGSGAANGAVSVTTPLGTSILAGFTYAYFDLNGDHLCDVLDLIILGNAIGQHGGIEDVDQSGFVDVLDLISVGNHIGESW